MGCKEPRRRVSRKTTIETLEDRQMFSADPVSGMLGGAIEHHGFDEPPLELHSEPLLEHHGFDEPLLELHGEPSLVHHVEQPPDFWYDAEFEPDLGGLLGDIEQTLASAHGLTGVTQARTNYGFLGTGQTVAIIDSGIAWDHAALGGGLGAEYRVVGGWDFTGENDANPYDDGPAGSHGTHVAGIVGAAASTSSDSGVAPGVDLVGLRVFDDAGAGYFSWVENALRWVHENRNAFENPITAVNLSLGTTWNSDTIPAWATLEDEFAQLEADGIFIAVSAGNSFTTFNAPGLSYPAASSYVVPVMSVDDNGSLSYYSQRHERAIAAPGRAIRSTAPDYIGNQNGVADDWVNKSGTSMAAPYVAGASVIVREAMQFVGYTNITQDMIYDHMVATADEFFDTATSAYYNRLNVGAAINALMPEDDFGSTALGAYILGTIGSGGSSISGLIGMVSDADYFQFTASVTGTVTFTADTTHYLTAAWTGSGVADGNAYTIDVVAGQTYTVGLATSAGIGYYDLDITAESTFSYTDWGTISQWQASDLSISGEAWYRVAASQAGYLTAEALFADVDGSVDLAWYDSNMQQVAAGVIAATGERVDQWVNAGDELYLCVNGTNADVDFRLTNLVSLAGSTVSISGTTGADTFTFTAGEANHTVAVNGVTYQFAAGSVSTINFNGGASSDSITMTGTGGDETARIDVGQLSVTGTDYSVLATSVELITAKGGGGADRVDLYDSATNDVLATSPTQVTLTGSGYSNTAEGFAQAWAWTSTGHDIAYTYDSAGDDLFRQWSTHFVSSGAGFFNYGRGFDESFAYSSTGYDRAILYDSPGDDLFRAWTDHHMYSGVGFANYIRGYDNVQAYATQGNDRAVFYDSSGNDQMKLWTDKAVMFGTGYFNYVSNFDRVEAYATAGNDRATFFDSVGNDWFRTWGDRSVMMGGGVFNYAAGFDSTYAYSDAGNDRADLFATGLNANIQINAEYATLVGTGFYNYVSSFENIYQYSSSGTMETSAVGTPLLSSQVMVREIAVLPTVMSVPMKSSVHHTGNRTSVVGWTDYYESLGQELHDYGHGGKAEREPTMSTRDHAKSVTVLDDAFANEYDVVFDSIGRGYWLNLAAHQRL